MSLTVKPLALFSGSISAMVNDQTESGKDTGIGWFGYFDFV